MRRMVDQALDGHRNPVAVLSDLVRGYRGVAREWVVQMRQFSRGADLLIGFGAASFGAALLGEGLDIPYLIGFPLPVIPTSMVPSPALPHMPFDLPGWVNKLEHTLVLHLLWQLVRPLGNRIRRDIFGSGPLPLSKPDYLLNQTSGPTMIAVSPSVIPSPRDWAGRAELTGYWFLELPKEWQPPKPLARFLDAGPPPVYVGFGSMTLDDPEATLDTIVGAVTRVGCRAVISAGWAGLKPQSLSADICAVDDVPHDWLFSRAASIVHHGGAGTTAAALRAGKPSVVMPFFSDQPFWGRWLVRLGAGVTPIPRRHLDAEKLAYAIERTLREEPCRQAAARIGRQIRAEDGVGRASDMVEDAAARRRMRPPLPLSIRPAHVEA